MVNYNLPVEPETYVHRIGRTARAGAEGDSISFCEARERDYLREIERLLRNRVPVDMEHAYHSREAMMASGADARPLPKQQRGRRRSGGGGGHNGGRRARPRRW